MFCERKVGNKVQGSNAIHQFPSKCVKQREAESTLRKCHNSVKASLACSKAWHIMSRLLNCPCWFISKHRTLDLLSEVCLLQGNLASYSFHLSWEFPFHFSILGKKGFELMRGCCTVHANALATKNKDQSQSQRPNIYEYAGLQKWKFSLISALFILSFKASIIPRA